MKRIFGVLIATFTLTSLTYSQSFFFADSSLEFDANLEGNEVLVSLKTSDEDKNTYAFERSVDGIQYEELMTLNPTRISNNFNFTDKRPLIGESYYRVVQKNNEGNDEVIDVLPIRYTTMNDQPLSAEYKMIDYLPTLIINSGADSKETLILRIYSRSEVIVEGEILGGVYELELDSRLSNGIYTVSIFAGGIEKSSKLLVY